MSVVISIVLFVRMLIVSSTPVADAVSIVLFFAAAVFGVSKLVVYVSEFDSFFFQFYILVTINQILNISHYNDFAQMAISNMKILIFFMVFYIVKYILVKKRTLVILIVLATMVHVVAGIFCYALGIGPIIEGKLRVSGLFDHPNNFANLLFFSIMFYMLFPLEEYFDMEKPALRIGKKTMLILSIMALFLTITLKDIAAFLLVGALISLDGDRVMGWGRRKRIAFFFSIAVLGVALVLLNGSLLDRIHGALQSRVDVRRGEELTSSLEWRFLHWAALVRDWHSRFFLLGVGLGNLNMLNGLRMASGQVYDAHSDIVLFLVEQGIVFFALLFLLFVRLLLQLRQKKGGDIRYGFVYYLFIGYLIQSTAGNVFYSLAFLYVFPAAFALVDGSERRIAAHEALA
jgi:hypothetical protein